MDVISRTFLTPKICFLKPNKSVSLHNKHKNSGFVQQKLITPYEDSIEVKKHMWVNNSWHMLQNKLSGAFPSRLSPDKGASTDAP